MLGAVALTCILAGGTGCGPKEPSTPEMKKILMGKPNQKFNPNDLDPALRERFNNYMKSGPHRESANASPQGSGR